MLRFAVPLLFLLSACSLTGPSKVVISPTAPQVNAVADRQLQARVAVSYRYIRDEMVAKQTKVSEDFFGKTKRQVMTVYHIAPASRAVLTKAFERVFKAVHVVEGKVNPAEFDLVIEPRLQVFNMDKRFHDADYLDFNITYRIYFKNQRGDSILVFLADGYSRLSEGSRFRVSANERATIEAMEAAAASIVKGLPGTNAMKPWLGS